MGNSSSARRRLPWTDVVEASSSTSAPSRARGSASGRRESKERAADDDDDDDALGEEDRKLDAFEILDVLGTGAVGRVYMARHRKSDRYFALKTMGKADVVRRRLAAHVASERAILATLRHPFVVKMPAHFQDDRALYVLLQYAPGGELFRRVRLRGRLTNHAAKFYAASVLLAVEYIHSKHVVHRDLKPENLLLDARGYLKVADFGHAKHLGRADGRTYTLCGTPEYAAPEMIIGVGHGKGVDFWALGVLCYELLAGYPPFYDRNTDVVCRKICAGKLDFPPFFDEAAKRCVRRLLSVDASRRLGCQRGGARGVKGHGWFRGFDFRALAEGRLHAPIPVELPDGEGDTSNFDRYVESLKGRKGWGGFFGGGFDGRGMKLLGGREATVCHAVMSTPPVSPPPCFGRSELSIKVKGGELGWTSPKGSPTPLTLSVFKDF